MLQLFIEKPLLMVLDMLHLEYLKLPMNYSELMMQFVRVLRMRKSASICAGVTLAVGLNGLMSPWRKGEYDTHGSICDAMDTESACASSENGTMRATHQPSTISRVSV